MSSRCRTSARSTECFSSICSWSRGAASGTCCASRVRWSPRARRRSPGRSRVHWMPRMQAGWCTALWGRNMCCSLATTSLTSSTSALGVRAHWLTWRQNGSAAGLGRRRTSTRWRACSTSASPVNRRSRGRNRRSRALTCFRRRLGPASCAGGSAGVSTTSSQARWQSGPVRGMRLRGSSPERPEK